MRLILLGCPGAGKGTQAQFLLKHYGVPLILTGDMLRSAVKNKHPLAEKIKAVITSGGLVDDEIVIQLIKDRLVNVDCKNGYILDGFPRTVKQAKALQDAKILIDAVIEIQVEENLVLERLTGRLVHLSSGRSYHVKYYPPKVAGRDDVTGDVLVQREDDREETVKNRLKVYHEKTEPLVNYYKNLSEVGYLSIDGNGSVDEVADRIKKALDNVGK